MVVKHPNTVSQTTGGSYIVFQDLANLKTKSGYARSKTPLPSGADARPSTLTLTNYKANLPSDAYVTKITVHYAHYKRGACLRSGSYYPCDTLKNKYISNIPSPKITLKNTGLAKKTGKAPTTTLKENSVTWSNLMLKASIVNSSDFGVVLNYPKKTNAQAGYLYVKYCYVEITYVRPSYGVSLTKVSGGYNNQEYKLKATITNKNKVPNSPSATISLPMGFTYTGASDGTVTEVQTRVLNWRPKISGIGSASVEITCIPSFTGTPPWTGTFVISETGYGATGSYTATISEAPAEGDTDTSDESQSQDGDIGSSSQTSTIKVALGDIFTVTVQVSESDYESHDAFQFVDAQGGGSDADMFNYYEDESSTSTQTLDEITIEQSDFETDYTCGVLLQATALGEYTIPLYGIVDSTVDSEVTDTITIKVIPQESSLTVPCYTVLSLSQEELDRLGTGYGYTVQSDMRYTGTEKYYEKEEFYSSQTPGTTIIDTLTNFPTNWSMSFKLMFNSFDNLGGISFNTSSGSDLSNSLMIKWSQGNNAFIISTPTNSITYNANLDLYYDFTFTKSEDTITAYVNNQEIGTLDATFLNNITTLYFQLFQQYGGQIQGLNMEVDAGETYVRDWYKNFRICVFNNAVEENVSYHMETASDSDVIEVDFVTPSRYDTTDCTLQFECDNTVYLQTGIEEEEPVYEAITEYEVTDIDSYTQTLVLKQYSNDTVTITMSLIDSENNTLYEMPYIIKFDQETNQPVEEVMVDTTDYSSLSNMTIFNNAAYWSTDCAGLNIYNSVDVEFTYNENYPLYILVTGDYPEGNPDGARIYFETPCIIESDEYTGRLVTGNYPIPIDDVVLNDGSVATSELEAFTKTEDVILYDFPLDDNYGTDTNMAIRGIEIVGNIEYTDEVSISCQLVAPTGESKTRTLILDENDNELSIGGMGDLWGFSTLDLVNLEQWEARLFLNNTLYDKQATTQIGDLQIVLYVETVENQNVKCYINGEDIAYYGAFITELEIPEGLETDTDYLKVDGTDTNDAYRMNIKEKTITLEIEIGDGCDLELATYSLREFTKLLVNDRDEYHRPIPKTIMFSHYPDVFWEYVMEDAFDTELDINTYTIKAKLVVPAGTSYDREATSTSVSGYVNGLAPVNPIVTARPTDSVISITEKVSGQKISIGYGVTDWTENIIEIDTASRKVWLKVDEDDTNPTDISSYVDFNSDWFALKGEYEFEGTNCIVRSVTYQERW